MKMKLVKTFIEEYIPYKNHKNICDAKNIETKLEQQLSDEKVAHRRNLFMIELKKWDYSSTRGSFFDESLLLNILKRSKESNQWD